VTVIRINAIEVPRERGEELARRFAARAGAVDSAPGFEGFELLRPTDERATWLVITRWADEPSFEAWRASAAFGNAHHGERADSDPHGPGGSGAGGHGGARPPVATASEVWAYEVVDLG
jgi:heme-degrading monooxygenase HmoA